MDVGDQKAKGGGMTKKMAKPEQIPDAAIEAARKAWLTSDDGAANDWRKAIAAAINAWPHSHHVNHHEWMKTGELASFDVVLPVILPLPQEKSND